MPSAKPLARSLCLLPLFLSGLLSHDSLSATLPAHAPIDILIVADEVNPHRLEDAELTQPEDLASALQHDSPLNTGRVITVDSQCADEAISLLNDSQRPQVLFYFAHRAARYCDERGAQPEFTAAIEQGLQEGMGLFVLHHGLYIDFTAPGAKDELLALIGARSNSIAWNTEDGQRVINVGGDHFISRHGLALDRHTMFEGMNSIPAGNYPYFINRPDELYEDTQPIPAEDEIRQTLFVSDTGDTRILGYVLTRQHWQGCVMAYQPGEYQPNALDDRNGPNYQIMMNALWYLGQPDCGQRVRAEHSSTDD